MGSEPREQRKLKNPGSALYSDDPAPGTADHLDRDRLVGQLARSLTDVSEVSESAVVGLVGPWGSGKSRLLHRLKERLGASGWYVGEHNPWAYSDYASAAAGFFTSIREVVPKDIVGSEWQKKLGEWVSRSAPLGAAGGVVGINGSAAVSSIGTWISGDQGPASLRAGIEKGLSKLDKPLLMIIDDLDRLAPDELLATFKLVRLLGRLPHVYYLMAYDEATLTDVLAMTELVGSQPGRAQQYLEKIVQVRLEIPPMLPEQQAGLANACIDEIAARHGITLSAGTNQRMQSIWQACLSTYLDTPRAVKRLFTQVDATWPDVAGEVDFSDFVAMTFLRVFEHRTFELITTRSTELLQQPSGVYFGGQKTNPRETWEQWIGLIEGSGARHPRQVANLLAELFVYLRSAKEGVTYAGASYREDTSSRMGVGTSEHFDRYIQVGVPDSDLSEKSVRQAAEELRMGLTGPALAVLIGRMKADAEPGIRKLRRENELEPLPVAPTLAMLGSIYFAAIDQKSGFLGLSPNFSLVGLVTAVLDRAPNDDAAASLGKFAKSGVEQLTLAATVVAMAMKDSERSHSWTEACQVDIAATLEAQLRAIDGPPSDHPRIMSLVWDHARLAGRDSTKALLWSRIDEGRWSLEEVLGLLVPIGQASNGRESWTSLGDFSESNVDELLGLDAVLERLSPRRDAKDPFEGQNDFSARVDEADISTRIARAIAGVEKVRARREDAEHNAAPLDDA